ncbi:MAG: 50S ribosomal protein L14e [Candidatus Micrarchaeota archaeon]
MAAINVGSVCVIIAGRRSGEQVTISSIADSNCVLTKDKKGKERKYSVLHLEPVSRN